MKYRQPGYHDKDYEEERKKKKKKCRVTKKKDTCQPLVVSYSLRALFSSPDAIALLLLLTLLILIARERRFLRRMGASMTL